jgi:hypothetical protein
MKKMTTKIHLRHLDLREIVVCAFSPVSFYVGKKEILLGDNPSRNYTELARKFSLFFESAPFDENFDIFSLINDIYIHLSIFSRKDIEE